MRFLIDLKNEKMIDVKNSHKESRVYLGQVYTDDSPLN